MVQSGRRKNTLRAKKQKGHPSGVEKEYRPRTGPNPPRRQAPRPPRGLPQATRIRPPPGHRTLQNQRSSPQASQPGIPRNPNNLKAYVQATATKVDLTGVTAPQTDSLFAKVHSSNQKGNFFQAKAQVPLLIQVDPSRPDQTRCQEEGPVRPADCGR